MQEFSSSFDQPEDTLTSMLLQKEKELQELSKMRIHQLQEQVVFKDKTIFDLESQIRRLSEDVAYNTSLVQQRDEEIAELEENMSALLKEKNILPGIIDDLKADCEVLQNKVMRSEDYVRELQGTKEVCNELQTKLQEAYSVLSKTKYEEQLQIEKFKELEQKINEQEYLNVQYKEEIKAKDTLVQKLLLDKETFEGEKNELRNKLKIERERCEREITLMRTKHSNDIRQVKDLRDTTTEQQGFTYKVHIEKLQNQIKSLLEDNKKSNNQIDYYQNSLLEKERQLNQEIFDLRKDVTIKSQQIEELQASHRAKDLEIDSIKEHIDHWKTLSQSRADELFKYKQMHIRSDERAENYLKEIDSLKSQHFDEIQRLKKEIDNLLIEKCNKPKPEIEDSRKYIQLKSEIERLSESNIQKDRENTRLSLLIENLKKDTFTINLDKQSAGDKIESTTKRAGLSSAETIKNRSASRDYIPKPSNRSKIVQVKSTLDKNFFEYSNVHKS